MAAPSELLSKSLQWLGKKSYVESDVTILRDLLREHNRLYYVESMPVVTDLEYDQLFKLLEKLEKDFSDFDPSSPTNRIDVHLSRQFEKGRHRHPMISLDNTYDATDLTDFEKRIRNVLKTEAPLAYCIELKFDGLGMSLSYENGRLVRALTRGNGVEGEDITVNAMTIKNIPKTIPFEGAIEIRGEVVMPHEAFRRTNEDRMLTGEKLFANPRNAASWSLRQLDYTVTAARGLEFYAYSVPDFEAGDFSLATAGGGVGQTVGILEEGSGKIVESYRDYVKTLSKWGFEITPYLHYSESLDDLLAEAGRLTECRPFFPFDIDGLVVKLDRIGLWSLLWTTEHHPRYAIAYKFPQTNVRTKVLDVEHSVGRSGAVTPVAHLEAVNVTGVTVRRATLHNYEELEAKDVRIGDQVFVIRAGEVIPEVVAVISEARTGEERIVEIPKNCPSCGAELRKDAGKVAIYCPNRAECPAQTLGALRVFVGKHAANIDGFGEKGISLFLSKGLMSDFTSIYRLSSRKVEILELEGFETKKTENLLSEIEKSRNMDLSRLLVGLGIPEIGRKTAKTLADFIAGKWKNEAGAENGSTEIEPIGERLLEIFLSLTPEELEEVKDFGPVGAQSVVSYFEENRDSLRELFSELSPQLPEAKKEGKLSGKSFCVTGGFEGISRDEIHDLVEAAGGEVRTSVSVKLDYLIVGSDAGSKLEKARQLNIGVLDLDGLYLLLRD